MLFATSPVKGYGVRPSGREALPCETANQVSYPSSLSSSYFWFGFFSIIFSYKAVPNPRPTGHTTLFTKLKPKSQVLRVIANTFISHSTPVASHKPQDIWQTVIQAPNYPVDPTTTSNPFSHHLKYIPNIPSDPSPYPIKHHIRPTPPPPVLHSNHWTRLPDTTSNLTQPIQAQQHLNRPDPLGKACPGQIQRRWTWFQFLWDPFEHSLKSFFAEATEVVVNWNVLQN